MKSTIVSLSLSVLLLAGCGEGLSPVANVSATVHTAVLTGKLRGGQQPISGAIIQLYAVGITGVKSAATPLIGSTIMTQPDGSFSITGDWNCTSNTAAYGANPLLYIVASGGNPGLASGTNNTAIQMMAALGPCSSVSASTFISMDELTTVAATYSLAPFMADVAHVGAQGANAAGVVNAFQTAAMLVSTTTGTSPGSALPVNATAPVSELNTLAGIVSACVNSTGTDGTCAALFTTTMSGGSSPSDIVAALLNVVANPGAQAGALLALLPANAPFQPTLSMAPSDWTVALNFTGGGLSSPAGIALDANGNAWIANASGNSVTELNNAGAFLTGATGYTGSNNILGAQGIAVDKAGNVWVADTLLSSVVELTISSGSVQSSTSYAPAGISGPTSLAIDSQDNVWVSNFAGGSVSELSSLGAVLGSGALTVGGSLQAPLGIAVDRSGNIWVTDNSAGDVVEFGNNQALLSGAGYTDGAMVGPAGLALDANGRAWVADNGSNAASLFGPAGSSLLTTPITGGGLSMPVAMAVDGSGTVWVANGQTAGGISELSFGQSAPLSPAGGLAALNSPAAIAIDASGSVWTANSGDDSVSKIVGIAAPTSTPQVASVGP